MLIKSLITRDRKDALEAQLQKIELKMSADNMWRQYMKKNVYGYELEKLCVSFKILLKILIKTLIV